jgi:hypothetical protein
MVISIHNISIEAKNVATKSMKRKPINSRSIHVALLIRVLERK